MAREPLVTLYIHMGTAAILVTDKGQSNKSLFLLHIPIMSDMEFTAMIGPVISEKKMVSVNGRTTSKRLYQNRAYVHKCSDVLNKRQ